MYGAVSVKYVSATESTLEAISFILYENSCEIYTAWGFNPYYLGIIVIAGITLVFCFGNIENSKIL